ncbi:polyamine-transporting ATPase [Agaricicola taiwanensis]|uniref:Polyamine-transporting ATPase n=1 Tax=Agaricicola taiwanensis TaxID=591372 RepID=A0A8J2VIV6_9RHOB|nr:ABC transporter ATP-binding protein [Agaricicola taiwanensis]GGE28048.1 polyamine-transporting ATPase [Agaricicola taiwanensis]
MKSKLSIKNVWKSYGSVMALKETSLEVPEGEFLTLLGPSGSGKTTLLMTLAGLVLPDGGEIRIDGVLSTFAPSHQRDIGMVFQNYALFPHLTIYENIAFPLRMRRMPAAEIDRKVKRILEIVRLPHVAERFPSELSGGQQQRIALARCTVYQPSIVLMDEPLGALDKKLRDQMQIEIKMLHEELKTTILYVTHDQEEAMSMSDRICLMNDGQIEQIGTPNDLYFEPKSIFTALFLGGANMFPVRIKDQDTDFDTYEGPGGGMIRAPRTNDPRRSGTDELSIMVRPEHITLLRSDEHAENAAEVRVRNSVMVGPVTKYFGELADGTDVTFTQLTTAPTRSAISGDTIRIGWPAARTVVLPGRSVGHE